MRRMLIAIGILVVLSVICAPVAGAKAAAPASRTLDVKGSPLVSFRVLVKSGSINDTTGREGLAALTAGLISTGGTGSLTSKGVLNALYPLAASLDARVDKEVTVFFGEVHRDNLEAFYRILSGLLLRPSFNEDDFKRVKDDLINSITMGLRSTNDEELGKSTLDVLIHGDHPYGHLTSGTVKGLTAITLKDAKEFYLHHYTRDNMVIGLAGADLAEIRKTMEKDFSALPSGKIPPVTLPARKPLKGMKVTLIEKPCISTAISIGFPLNLTRASRDFYPLMVMNSYFGEHRTFHGLLMNHMRAERGLNYGDYSYIENFIQDGGGHFCLPNVPRRQQYFSIWIRPVSNENRHFAMRQAIRELKMLVEKGMSSADFETARNFVLNYSRLWVQSQSRRLGYMLDSDFYGTKFFIDELQKALPKLTVDEVNRAIRRNLNAENLQIVAVTSGAEAFRNALVTNAASPITYANKVPRAILEEDRQIEVFPLSIRSDDVKIVKPEELFDR